MKITKNAKGNLILECEDELETSVIGLLISAGGVRLSDILESRSGEMSDSIATLAINASHEFQQKAAPLFLTETPNN